MDYVERISNNHLTTWGRGDWVPVKSKSNKELTSSVYFYVDTKILAAAAKLFGKQADYEYYNALSEEIKQAVNDKFLNRETGIYAERFTNRIECSLAMEDCARKVDRKSGS